MPTKYYQNISKCITDTGHTGFNIQTQIDAGLIAIFQDLVGQGMKIYSRKSELLFLVFCATFNEMHRGYFDLFITQNNIIVG